MPYPARAKHLKISYRDLVWVPAASGVVRKEGESLPNIEARRARRGLAEVRVRAGLLPCYGRVIGLKSLRSIE